RGQRRGEVAGISARARHRNPSGSKSLGARRRIAAAHQRNDPPPSARRDRRRLHRRAPRVFLKKGLRKPQDPIRHFGVLIPSTNTTGEIEYSRLLPPQWQARLAPMATSSRQQTPVSPRG